MKEGEFGKIRKAIKINKEVSMGNFAIEEKWPTRDSSIEDFSKTFFSCISDEYNTRHNFDRSKKENIFKNYIEDTLKNNENKKLYAIEFGGSGSELFRGFSKDFFYKTIGICLKDLRKISEKFSDKLNNHFVIEGDILDIFDKKIYNDINKKFNMKKVDLIISRMMGAVYDFKKNEAILNNIARKWYSILNENGLMFVQFALPKVEINTEELVHKWVGYINQNFKDKIEIQVEKNVFCLHKKFGAPEELPEYKPEEINTVK